MPSTSGSVSCASQTMSVHSFIMATGGDKEPKVINISDNGEEGEDDWQDIGPVNVAEAKANKDKVEDVFETLSLMLKDDRKDAILATVTAFKKLAVKHWTAMKDVDMDVVLRSIRDSAGIYL